MVKLPQVRQRHVQCPHQFRLFRQVQRRRRPPTHRPVTHPLQDAFDVVAGFGPALLDGLLHRLGRLLRQQLHDTNVVLDTASRSMLFLQIGAQFGKQRRQLPATEDVGVVQCGRLAVQGFQVVLRIEALLVLPIRPRMAGNHLAAGHHLDVVQVALDRHRLKGGRARRAVAVAVEAYRLVLVHFARLEDAGVEREGRK